MSKVTTSDRLKQILSERGIKQTDILAMCQPFCQKYNVKIGSNDLSQYITGKVQPRQDKLSVLGMALNVNEVWLMGYNVSPDVNALDESHGEIKPQVQELIPSLNRLDDIDLAEVRGEVKGMLKQEKYKSP